MAFNAFMPGEHNWLTGQQMPGQQPPAAAMPQAPVKEKRPLMNAFSKLLEFGAPEAFEAGRQKRMQRDIGGALADGNYGGAADMALRGGNLDAGMKLRGMADERQQAQMTEQRKAQAQGTYQLFSALQPAQINDYAMQDPVGFERMTGMSSEEYLSAAKQFQSVGMTQDQFRAFVLEKAQAELGAEQEAYTLSPGARRFDAQGNMIAENPADPKLPQGMMINPETGRPEYIPEFIQGQKAIAEARGGNQNNVQSVFTGEDGMQYIVRRDGSFEPLGVKARNPYQITDVGGVPTAIDRQTARSVAITTPETVAQNKATIATVTANEEARRQAQQDLPKAVATIDRGIATLEALKKSPGFNTRYGFASIIPAIPGTDMADTQALINQIGGQAFLTAFESLKGGGQITEIEGQKATQAITVLTTQGISVQMAARAIDDLIEVQKAAKARATAQAGASYAPKGADTPTLKYNPETGEFE